MDTILMRLCPVSKVGCRAAHLWQAVGRRKVSTPMPAPGGTRTGKSGEAANRGIGTKVVLAGGVQTVLLVRPNVRAKRATTAGRQARAGENVPCTTGPGLVACRWRSA